MNEEERPFKIIKLKNYDILLPFVCHKCGECCRGFAPQLPANHLPKIALRLNKTENEIRVQHAKCYEKKFSDSPKDCIFLNDNNQCMIYPLRPECCRLYPLDTDFGTAGVDCPGKKEFDQLVEAFFSGRIYAAMYDPRDRPNKDIRTIPTREWRVIWEKFMKTKPSEIMVQEFTKMNKVPTGLLG